MNSVEIKLNGKRGGIALVDEEFAWVAKHSWTIDNRGYVRTNAPRNGMKIQKKIMLHHLVAGKPKDKMVTDHINHDKLDNRKSNLRHCTNAQNNHNQKRNRNNTTGFKGTSRSGKKYRAHIWLNGKSVKLGTFASVLEAARAYEDAAKKYFKEYAYADAPKP